LSFAVSANSISSSYSVFLPSLMVFRTVFRAVDRARLARVVRGEWA
jgi:hypothetical protein